MDLRNKEIPVLHYLSEKRFIGLEELSNRLLLSEENIEKQIEQLKQLGYNFSIDTQKGYRIISRPDILLPSEIKKILTTRYIGQNIYYFPELVQLILRPITAEKG